MTEMIVIGGGPAGVTAALEAAALGARTTVVTAEPIGGRATWHSLLPSKVYLTAADHLGEAGHNPVIGLTGDAPRPDLPTLRTRIADLAEAWGRAEHTRLADGGVRVVFGRARYTTAGTIEVTTDGSAQTLAFDRSVVATGSVPLFPPAIRPDGRRILAPRLAGAMAVWPDHMAVIGGGVTGAEFAYFFNRMGVAVTWITDLARLLPRSDPDLVEGLERALIARGVAVVRNAPVSAVAAADDGVSIALEDGRTLSASHAFLALGRRPDLDGLGLDAAGITAVDGAIAVDDYGLTSARHIAAVGDAAGPPYVANRGQSQARVAARALLGAPTSPFRPDTVIEAVYTQPQLAQVGLTESAALAAGRHIRVLRAAYGDALKPHLAAETEGQVKLLADPEDGRILGGGAVGDRAADVLAPVAVAIAAGMTVGELAPLFPAYPSLAELVGIAARSG